MLENTIDYRKVFGNREEQLLHFMMDDFTYGIIRNRYSRQQSDYLMKKYIDDRFYTLHIFENSGPMLRKEKEFVGLVDMKENVLYCNYYGMHNYKRIQEEFTLKANGIEGIEADIEKRVNEQLKNLIFDRRHDLASHRIENEDYEHMNTIARRKALRMFMRERDFHSRMDEKTLLDYMHDEDDYFFDLVKSEMTLSDDDIISSFYDMNKIVAEKAEEAFHNDKIFKYLSRKVYRAFRTLDVMDEIIQNRNHEYDQFYKRRKMIMSLSDINAKNVSVTIEYDNDRMTFKYDREKLIREMSDPTLMDSFNFGKAFEPVREFVENHRSGYRSDFEFSHIESMSFKGKTFYDSKGTLKMKKRMTELERER